MSVPSLTSAAIRAVADLKGRGFKPDFLFVGILRFAYRFAQCMAIEDGS